jgi:ferritin-like protein
MARVAREMVQRAGVDVDKLLNLLIRNASAELTTYYYYTILRVNLIGLEGEGLKEITEDARIEDRNHFEALVPRIYEWGAVCPKAWSTSITCRPVPLRSCQPIRQIFATCCRY